MFNKLIYLIPMDFWFKFRFYLSKRKMFNILLKAMIYGRVYYANDIDDYYENYKGNDFKFVDNLIKLIKLNIKFNEISKRFTKLYNLDKMNEVSSYNFINKHIFIKISFNNITKNKAMINKLLILYTQFTYIAYSIYFNHNKDINFSERCINLLKRSLDDEENDNDQFILSINHLINKLNIVKKDKDLLKLFAIDYENYKQQFKKIINNLNL